MSALAAYRSVFGRISARTAVEDMLSAQHIHGPDARDLLDLTEIAIGRNLHRTLPEDMFDRQPIQREQLSIVADIRLDDRDHLREMLGLSPMETVDMADSEFVLLAWQRWGEAMFDHVYGDYAFILWDAGADRLVLARDALGGCPLHYHVGTDFVAVASMPKGLFALPGISSTVGPESLAAFVAGLSAVDDETIHVDIRKVRPGEMVTIARDGAITRRTHWHPPNERRAFQPGHDYAAELLDHVDRAVRTRLRGVDAVIAAQLSSGLDSSAVVTSAALQVAGSDRHILALTAAPREGYSEPPPPGRHGHEDVLATATAALYPAIDHRVVRSAAEHSLFDDLDRYAVLCDRPITNGCNLGWIHQLHDAARAGGASILLIGGMGNATLSFDGKGSLQELARLPTWRRFLRMARTEARTTGARLPGTLFRGLAPRLPVILWRAIDRWRNGRRDDPLDHVALTTPWRTIMRRRRELRASHHDAHLRAPYQFPDARSAQLAWLGGDRANHAKGALAGWGIDIRDPTADRALVEYCLRLPLEAWRPSGKPRSLAVAALRDRLPAAILSSSTRGLQAFDWHEQLTASRQDIRDEIDRLAGIGKASALLDIPRLKALADHWPSRHWHRAAVTQSYRQTLTRGITAGRFLRLSGIE